MNTKTINVISGKIESLSQHFNITNVRKLGPSTYSGPTLEKKPIEDLKKFGVFRVIDFRKDCENAFSIKCKNAGIEYYKLPFDEVQELSNCDYFVKGNNQKMKIKNNFIDLLKKFFSVIDKEHVYVGCQYGIDRTNIAVILNYLLNPNFSIKSAPVVLKWPEQNLKNILNRNIKSVKKIFKAMDEQQRKAIGLSINDKEQIYKRVKILLRKQKETNAFDN